MSRPEDTPGITPVPELFTYHIFGVPEEAERYRKDPSAYSLTVGGLVEPAVRLSLAQIRDDYDPVTDDMVLQCMTNVHWGRIRITGARLLDVLEEAGIPGTAGKVAFRGADGFDTDLLLADIRERPDAFLLAYAMNDEPIPPEHGFPVRLASDGRYGYKWPKWLVEVLLVDYDYKGHYEDKRGWSDRGRRGEPVT